MPVSQPSLPAGRGGEANELDARWAPVETRRSDRLVTRTRSMWFRTTDLGLGASPSTSQPGSELHPQQKGKSMAKVTVGQENGTDIEIYYELAWASRSS
jgi:hypothetical protein